MSNVLQAIITIANNPIRQLKASYLGSNRINNIGEALENYIQDVFANTVNEPNVETRKQGISNTFSYLGNQNNPPDMMLKQGDAIEVKKIQSIGSAIALNSSHPKHKLYADDPKITSACRRCEDWQEKDIIYAVGVTSSEQLQHLTFVYGDCYAASKVIYQRIGNTIKTGIATIADVEFAETKELGRVNRVDPLGITYLRIRGMWHIENPFNVFGLLYHHHHKKKANNLTFSCILRQSKYLSFSKQDRLAIEQHPHINCQTVNIANPDNPAQLITAKLITMALAL